MNSFLISIKDKQWWLVLLAINILMLIGTFFSYIPGDQQLIVARLINLAGEKNFAPWFSGMQLLLTGLAFLSFSMLLWEKNRAQAKAIGAIGLVAVILFTDEVGSLHERMDVLLNIKAVTNTDPVALLPYFLLLLGLLTYGLKGLYQYRSTLGTAWIRVIAGFSFFTLVYLQEKIEHSREWSGVEKSFRAVFEEGTELIGFAFLLSAAVTLGHRLNIQKQVNEQEGISIPILVPTFTGIQRLFFGFIIAALPLIALRLMHSPEILQLNRLGDFGYIPVVAIYGLAALVCYRSSLLEPVRQWQWRFSTCICLILSVNATALFHRSFLRIADLQHLLTPWRAEYDLLWTIPLSMVMLALMAGRKSHFANGSLIMFWIAAIACVQRPDANQFITYFLALMVSLTVYDCLAKTRLELISKTEPVRGALPKSLRDIPPGEFEL